MRSRKTEHEPREALLADVRQTLAASGVVCFPTDTVYGLLCDPNDPLAIERIYRIKTRPKDKQLILLFASVDALLVFAEPVRARIEDMARAHLPGGLTIVAPCPAGAVPQLVAQGGTIGMRVPRHSLLCELLAATGPLASTSANASGDEPFIGRGTFTLRDVDLFVDGGPAQAGLASTIVDYSREQPVVLREGAIAKAELATWLVRPDGV